MGGRSLMSKKIVIKTTVRMLVYQVLILFAGVSLTFIMNPVYWGNRSGVVARSYNNIFHPIKYDSKVEEFIKKMGRTRLFFEICQNEGYQPDLFEILPDSEKIINEEWYMCEYQYVNRDGILDVYEYRTRIKWKPWELQYPDIEDIKPVNGAEELK